MQKYLQTSFNRKIANSLKKKWSAPSIMSAFLIICMLFIYSCESLGLSSTSIHITAKTNLPQTKVTLMPEAMIPSINKGQAIKAIESESINTIIKITQERKVLLMKQILLDGAYEQIQYSDRKDSIENTLFDI